MGDPEKVYVLPLVGKAAAPFVLIGAKGGAPGVDVVPNRAMKRRMAKQEKRR